MSDVPVSVGRPTAGPDVVDLTAPDVASPVATNGGDGLGGQALLEAVVTALNSPLELKDVLRLLGEIALEASGADRFSLFLLEGRRLLPAVAVAPQPDHARWTAFRSMGPIDLDPGQREYVTEGTAVAVEDARTHPIVPAAWVEEFALRGMVLVPLRSKGEACGLMVLDWAEARSFRAAEIRILEALGAYVGVAVSTARPFDTVRRRARLQEALARGAATLASPLEPDEIVRLLLTAYRDLLSPAACGVALVDEQQAAMTTVATTGAPIAPMAFSQIPDRIVTLLGETWARDKRPVELGDDPWIAELLGGTSTGAAWYLALPLLCDGHTRGGVLLGFTAEFRLDEQERAAARALAAIGAAALERRALLNRLDSQLARLGVLYQVSTALAEGADAAALVTKLDELLSPLGIEVVGVAFRDRRLARHLGGEAPGREERESWKADNGWAHVSDDTLAVPMRLGRRLIGDLRVRASRLEPDQRSFLEALAGELGEVATRRALRAEIDAAALERAVSSERERFASDLHDTAGQLFVAIGLLSRRLSEEMPGASPWKDQAFHLAELADRGNDEIDQVIRALAFLPVAKQGLAPSLRALAESLAADSGLDIAVQVRGRPRRLAPDVERALYRVAHEALANAWRHAACRTVTVELRFFNERVGLRVTDDGVGMGASGDDPAVGGARLRLGVSGMHRAMAEVGGNVAVGDAPGRGTMVVADWPLHGRASGNGARR